MATTTNYGWVTPDDTALVKDGAAAIRTLGSSADTTTKNLNPETTLGDISFRSSTSDVNTRLGIGTAGQVLTVVGGLPAYATPASGALAKVTAGSFSAVTGVNIDSIFSATFKNYFFLLYDFGSSGFAGNTLSMQYRFGGSTDSGANYYGSNFNIERGNAQTSNGYAAASSITLLPDIGGGGSYCGIYFSRVGNSSQSPKFYANYFSSSNQDAGMSAGSLEDNQTYDGIRLSCANNMAGSFTVYGLAN